MNSGITYLKALGIMLMVLGHSMCSIPYAIGFLSMFHMPLFFIASGYCFNAKYLADPLTFLKKRAKGLYVPFVKWTIVFVLLRPLFFATHIYDTTYGFLGEGATPYDWKDTLWTCWLAVSQMRGNDWLLGGYWFLNALFFGSIIAWITLRLSKKSEYALAASLVLLTVTHLTNFHIVFLNINTRAFAAAFLFIAGYVMKEKRMPVFSLWAVVAAIALTFVGIEYWPLAIDYTEYEGWQLFPHLLTAILCTWAFYSLFTRYAMPAAVQRFFSFVGQHTLSILTWHLLSFKVVSLVIILIYHLPIAQLGEFPVIAEYATQGWWLLYLLAGVGLPLAMTMFIDFCLKGRQSTR